MAPFGRDCNHSKRSLAGKGLIFSDLWRGTCWNRDPRRCVFVCIGGGGGGGGAVPNPSLSELLPE